MRYGLIVPLCAVVFLSGCVSVRAEGTERTAELKAGCAIDVTLLAALDSHQAKAKAGVSDRIRAPILTRQGS